MVSGPGLFAFGFLTYICPTLVQFWDELKWGGIPPIRKRCHFLYIDRNSQQGEFYYGKHCNGYTKLINLCLALLKAQNICVWERKHGHILPWTCFSLFLVNVLLLSVWSCTNGIITIPHSSSRAPTLVVLQPEQIPLDSSRWRIPRSHL